MDSHVGAQWGQRGSQPLLAAGLLPPPPLLRIQLLLPLVAHQPLPGLQQGVHPGAALLLLPLVRRLTLLLQAAACHLLACSACHCELLICYRLGILPQVLPLQLLGEGVVALCQQQVPHAVEQPVVLCSRRRGREERGAGAPLSKQVQARQQSAGRPDNCSCKALALHRAAHTARQNQHPTQCSLGKSSGMGKAAKPPAKQARVRLPRRGQYWGRVWNPSRAALAARVASTTSRSTLEATLRVSTPSASRWA